MRLAATGRFVRFARSKGIETGCANTTKLYVNSPSPHQRCYQSTVAESATVRKPSSLSVDGTNFLTDDWTNVPPSILALLPCRLHLQPSHPISITRQVIERSFPGPKYINYNDLHPIVSVAQNFDSLGFPQDHPGRSRTDTYYINKDTVLRTHTSAHEAEIFRSNASEGYTISADVYRRDAIDRSHYPVFHQMEGARMWDRRKVPEGDIARAVWADLGRLPKHDLQVEDPNPTIHPNRNPLQAEHHSPQEVEAIAAHLKRTLEGVVVDLFSRAKKAAVAARDGEETAMEPLKVRWVEAYFPFTSPGWELEVYWQGDWLEVLGCGVSKQELLINSGVPHQLGWAFGVGLERVAMILYSIPDIRLFWSKDERFLSQFSSINQINTFVPFSKHPACYKDVSFWLRSSSSNAGGGSQANAQDFHENDFMEIVRDVGGDRVEDVRLTDAFVHPTSGRKSLCYRINYRSLERTLSNQEANQLQQQVEKQLVQRLGVELR